MEKTPNQIKADKWVDAHFGDASETIKAVAHASYYSGLVDQQEEMRYGQTV